LLPNFSGVIDTAEINLTPLKSQTDFTSPFSSFKEKIQQKWQNPFTIQVLEEEKVEVVKTSFSVSAVSMTQLKPILETFEAIISANTMPYAKRV
jgi:hypothetical protein